MKILTVVGARPQFIKASAFSRALSNYNSIEKNKKIKEVLVHTGQHFDKNMSNIFFKELEIPKPKLNLNISSLPHGAMTGRMIEALEKVFDQEMPDYVLVYGDTNSTLAGSLAASKLAIPIIHIESGLRSFRKTMPEEINRVITDKLSELLFCPSELACRNLAQEGILDNVYFVGDVMFDVVLHLRSKSKSFSPSDLGIREKEFFLCTLHREENTNNKKALRNILEALNVANKEVKIIFPIHPRTKQKIKDFQLTNFLKDLTIIEPISYSKMLNLLDQSSLLFTDSGGMQKEALYLETPCITLREETEWTETVDLGLNILCGSDKEAIIEASSRLKDTKISNYGNPYGNGDASEKIIKIISKL